jgi:hypothetical protein
VDDTRSARPAEASRRIARAAGRRCPFEADAVGVGRNKLERYGELFLEAIAAGE